MGEVLRTFDDVVFEEVAGRDWYFVATVKDGPAGDPLDLTGATVTMVVRDKWGGTGPFTMTLGSGFTIPTPANGQIVVQKRLTGVAVGTYVFDLSVEIGGVLLSTIRGTLRVLGGA